MIVDLRNNICLRWSLPEPFSPWLGWRNHESARHIRLSTYLLILQHQTYINLCVFCYLNPELRIVKPSIIALWLSMITDLLESLLCLVTCCLLETRWALTAIGFSSPLRLDWINLPTLRKHFINNDLFELNHKVSETHPPWTIRFLRFNYILHIFFDCLELLPVISLFTERTSPHSFITPWISNPDEFQVILREISHIHDGVVVVLENTLLALICIFECLLFGSVDGGE